MLDLEGNKVDDLGALQYLAWCPQLAVLTLADNPIAADPTYQAQVITYVIVGAVSELMPKLIPNDYKHFCPLHDRCRCTVA